MLSLNFSKDEIVPGTSLAQDEYVRARVDMSSACLCGSRLPLQVRLGLRSRTRPVIDGRWCCGEACLQARVAAYVRRSVTTQSSRQDHQHRVPLGLLLLSQGAITQEQLRFARKMSEGTGERIGDVLVEHCGLPQQRVVQALATQWGCSAWDVGGTIADGMACVAPRVVLHTTGMLPLRLQSDGAISVAFLDAPDAPAVLALRSIHARRIDAGIASVKDFAKAVTQVAGQQAVEVKEYLCVDEAEVIRLLTKTIQRLAPAESRWTRIRDMFWVRMWLEPIAFAGGVGQTEDVMDLVVHLRPRG